ncbi:methionyl-tRNA synthetase 1 isoform X2 [Rhodnius prolixus]
MDEFPVLKKLLSELELALDGKDFIVEEMLTVADVCLWGTLFPVFTDENLCNRVLTDQPNIKRWWRKLNDRQEWKAAQEKFKLKRGLPALQSVSASCWYPEYSSILPSPERKKKQSNSLENNFAEDHSEFKEITLTEEQIANAVSNWNKPLESRQKLKKPSKPIIPVPNERNILITSALPYVNNVPHLGNIIGCVLSADVFARYCRFRSYNTLFISGTDEYGTATETKAIEEGLTPQQICDKYFALHSEVYDWFNISFDHFGRTTSHEQIKVAQEIFLNCHKNGFTSTSAMDQLLCEKCNRYLADRFVEGTCPGCKYEDARGDQCDGCGHLINAVDLINPRCKLCQNAPIVKQSQQLFLELPKVQDRLKKWVEETCDGWSSIARVITKAWLKEGLKPRCITRDLKWGVPVPLEGFEGKVFYVWFDAPIGYMSMTKSYSEEWLRWWKPSSDAKVTLYQFMAKDNVPFHSIMFPATLFAAGGNYTLINHLMATEYLNYENGKFSKSRGVGVFGNDAKDTGIPSDIFRFYLLYIRPESQDTNFSWADLAMKNNTELLNNLGNFILRSLAFAEKFLNSEVPSVVLDSEEQKLLGYISLELKGYISSLEKGHLRDGIKYILNISRHGNHYMQSLKAWVLIKGDEKDKKKAASGIGLLCNVVCLISSLLQPYMPTVVDTVAKQMNVSVDIFTITEHFQPYLRPGHKIGKPLPLFTKIEQHTVDALKAQYAGKQKSLSPGPVNGSDTNSKPETNSVVGDAALAIATLEEAVAKQGDLVRSMKAAGKSKDELKPMIATLLDLKKQLAVLKGEEVNSVGNEKANKNSTKSQGSGKKKKEKK